MITKTKIHVADAIDQIQMIIRQSNLMHVERYSSLPDYEAGATMYSFTIEYALMHGSISVFLDRDNDNKMVKRRNNMNIIRQKFLDLSDDIQVRWSNSTATPEGAIMQARYVSKIADLALHIRNAMKQWYIFDVFYQLPEPDRPNMLDKIEHHFSTGKGDDMRKKLSRRTNRTLKLYCRNHDLKVSGNKDELVERLIRSASVKGDAAVAEKYRNWIHNQYERAAFDDFDKADDVEGEDGN